MNPENVGCLTAARIDCCCLANNHILDWGCEGLRDTIEVLDGAKIAHTGAGFDLQGATAPAVLDLDTKGRVLVFALGSPTSGIPLSWAAMDDRPGVNLVTDLSESSALRVADEVCAFKQFGDLLVVSIHWGENWGYEISANQINFAHRLIDAGVDLIHGHSSHHVKAIEVYRERLILYGCGDFLTDYEGIEGYEEFRGDLALIFLASFESLEHRLSELRIAPVHSQRFRLAYVPSGDAQWLSKLMSDICRPFATRVQLRDDKNLFLEWDHLS
jgi:poly-gamma-glutamate synthesis protein (capsule biosynthesis protein)